MKRELIFWKTLAISLAIGMIVITIYALYSKSNQGLGIIDVERINVRDADGTVRFIIAGKDAMPSGGEVVNGIPQPIVRGNMPPVPGILYFNDDGMEVGGFAIHGMRDEEGNHFQFGVLTFDQYDGDQVFTTNFIDRGNTEDRMVATVFRWKDRPSNESASTYLKEYHHKIVGLSEEERLEFWANLPEGVGSDWKNTHERMTIGGSNKGGYGVFLSDDKGRNRASFFIDSENNAKLQFLNEAGEVVLTLP